jgi:leucyl aminopeptidase (aminopeptidase T)
MEPRAFKGAVNLLRTCANVRPGEEVLVVTDSATDPGIAGSIIAAASRLGIEASSITMTPRALPGDEPPASVIAAMLSADVIICPTTRTLYHTNARTTACRKGARFISMAGATISVLASSAMFADFPKQEQVLARLVNRLTQARHIRVTNPAGTDLGFNVLGRRGHGVSGMATRPGEATGAPDIEAYIAPREDDTNGVLYVDGSTSVTGVVKQPIKIGVQQGMARSISGGSDAKRLSRVLREAKSRTSFRVAEFGIGLNPLAHIRGSIIEDEGKLGTAHVALGDNTKLGGKNSAPIHIDLVLKTPHIKFDGITVLKGKRLTL